MTIRNVTVVDVTNGSLGLVLLPLLLAVEGRAIAQEKDVPEPAPDGPAALQDMELGDFEFRDERDITEGPRPPPVNAQGKSRVSRAFRLFAVAHEAAVAHGVPLTWRLRVVPGLDHSPIETLGLDFEEIAR